MINNGDDDDDDDDDDGDDDGDDDAKVVEAVLVLVMTLLILPKESLSTYGIGRLGGNEQLPTKKGSVWPWRVFFWSSFLIDWKEEEGISTPAIHYLRYCSHQWPWLPPNAPFASKEKGLHR